MIDAPDIADLDPSAAAALLDGARTKRLSAGEWLCRQDDPGDEMFVVRSGRVEIIREFPEPPIRLRLAGRGDVVGELAFLTDSPRSAAVRAVRDSEISAVDRSRLSALLRDDPTFGPALLRMLGRRVSRAGPELLPDEGVRPSQVVAVVGMGGEAPLRAIAESLERALRSAGSVVAIERDDLAAGSDVDPAARLGEILDTAEREHDLVLLVAPSVHGSRDGSELWRWAATCARQADRVVVVVDGEIAEPTDRDDWLRDADVVVWDEVAGSHVTVARLLDGLRARTHLFAGPDTSGRAAARVARRLLGRSVGLVLSGGGARGLAHIGVLEVLVDAGVEIDRVGGTSMGAFVGGLFALGHNPAEIFERARHDLRGGKVFADYTVPLVSLIRGRRAAHLLDRVFGARVIESLPREYFCVSADLLTANVVVHRRGRLADAVGASMSLPGLAPPVESDGRLLVDGGVLDNLPVDVMAERIEGPIIAVDVMGRMRADRPDGGLTAPLRRLVSGGSESLPGIGETLARATVLGSRRQLRSTLAKADLVITPDVTDVGLMDFDQIDRVVDAGRRAAHAALDRATLRKLT